MKKQDLWLITAKTNIHVGNENTSSYGLIDKAIQRDVLTKLPCINSSSLKGALNEHATCEKLLGSDDRIKVFGVDKTDTTKDTSKGLYTFFDAQLLLLPIPSDKTLYELITSEGVLKRFEDKAKSFGIELSVENVKVELSKMGYTFSIKSDEEFIEYCSDYNLPIIARNKLENGLSINLWYEQVLPAESVFYTMIDNKGDVVLTEKLDHRIVQIGANATIGYGYCKFTNLK